MALSAIRSVRQQTSADANSQASKMASRQMAQSRAGHLGWGRK